jgi:hypothetical protein
MVGGHDGPINAEQRRKPGHEVDVRRSPVDRLPQQLDHG